MKGRRKKRRKERWKKKRDGRETCLVNGEFLDPIVGVSREGGKREKNVPKVKEKESEWMDEGMDGMVESTRMYIFSRQVKPIGICSWTPDTLILPHFHHLIIS